MLNQQVPLDRVFHALADPSRRGMVERLARGPASVSELARPLDMSLAAVVQHLQVLDDRGQRHLQRPGQLTDRGRPPGQPLHHPPPAGVGEGVEHPVERRLLVKHPLDYRDVPPDGQVDA